LIIIIDLFDLIFVPNFYFFIKLIMIKRLWVNVQIAIVNIIVYFFNYGVETSSSFIQLSDFCICINFKWILSLVEKLVYFISIWTLTWCSFRSLNCSIFVIGLIDNSKDVSWLVLWILRGLMRHFTFHHS
jgi:hypothetical protein